VDLSERKGGSLKDGKSLRLHKHGHTMQGKNGSGEKKRTIRVGTDSPRCHHCKPQRAVREKEARVSHQKLKQSDLRQNKGVQEKGTWLRNNQLVRKLAQKAEKDMGEPGGVSFMRMRGGPPSHKRLRHWNWMTLGIAVQRYPWWRMKKLPVSALGFGGKGVCKILRLETIVRGGHREVRNG